jgi:alpha-1,3-rhamnosyl/mannosyltransferase
VHPLVVTIHDVSYARHPEWYPYRRDPARRAFYRRSALAADIVVTDSEFSRQEICSAYGIPAERVRVISLGVGVPFTPPDAGQGGCDRTTRTILHVGDLHPRRNIGVLVEALALIRGESSLRDVELVLVGGDDGTAGTVTARADALGLSRVVRRVPRCSDETLVGLMRQAAVLAYPSLYEGFGLPALEAMACGLPVVASRAASIPEVVGEAGLLVDPLDVRAWRDALSAVLTSPARAASMRLAGVTRAATFTWRRTAIATLEVYRGVAAREPAS